MSNQQRTVTLILVVVAIVLAVVALEMRRQATSVNLSPADVSQSQVQLPTASADRSDIVAAKAKKYAVARELISPDGFINVDDSLTIGSLIGKQVILIDFWTYSCINCQRTLPYLNAWYEKYRDQGLTIIGVHTPEFEFEKVYDNVKAAVAKYGVKYPVVQDNDYLTWTAYGNHYWPHKYLIDIDGYIVYDHIGEGGYDESEKRIVEALNERSQVLGQAAVEAGGPTVPGDAVSVDFGQVASPETYLGYGRSEYQANSGGPECRGAECQYDFSQPAPSDHQFALTGRWRLEKERAIQSGAEGGSIILRFTASKVNLVAGTSDPAGQPVKASVWLDGQPVKSGQAGIDLTDGTVEFGMYDLYNLIDLKGQYGTHTLEIKMDRPGLSGYAFTFG